MSVFVKISELPAKISLAAANIFAAVQAGVTRQIDLQTIADWIIQTAASFVQSGTGAIADAVQNDLRNRAINVLQFIPPALHAAIKARTNTTDLAAYIQAADTACGAGALGLDGSTVLAEKALYFPGGTYKHTGLTYSGAPWFGDGVNATILDYYGTGTSVTAVGAVGAYKRLNISDLDVYGGNATGNARGIDFGLTLRSSGALRRVYINAFPGPGLYQIDDAWIMSFEDVNIAFCATASGSAIQVDPAVTNSNAFDWYSLVLEQNGNGSTVAGGINLDQGANVVNTWNFFGGTIEGNKGLAEAQFLDCNSVNLYGVYTETGLLADGYAIDGLIFGGNTTAVVSGLHSVADAPVFSHVGPAVRVIGTSKVSIGSPFFGATSWATDISVEDTATLNLAAEGNLDRAKLTIAAGAKVTPFDSTYVPTLTNSVNLDGSTHYTCFYTRQGNQVTVNGKFDADPSATGQVQLGISLPIASNIANAEDLAGSGAGGSAGDEVLLIEGDATNDRALVIWVAGSASNAPYFFNFSYRVL